MPVIYNRTFTEGNQRYISLGGDDYVRTMSIGTNWTRLRIGILCSLSTVHENTWNLRSPSFGIGVCHNTDDSISTQASNHLFGVGIPLLPTNVAGANVLTYNAGSGGNSYFSVSGFRYVRYQSGVETAGVGSFNWYVPTNTTLGGAIARRGLLILTLNKSAMITGNLTLGLTGNAANHCALDMTSADLYAALEWYGTVPTFYGTALTNSGLAGSQTFDETVYGTLNTVFIWWNHHVVPLQLYEIAVYRFG